MNNDDLQADDEEPITEEWLDSLAPKTIMSWNLGVAHYLFGIAPANVLMIYRGPFDWRAVINNASYANSVAVSTRGDVRRLCAALKIALVERPLTVSQ